MFKNINMIVALDDNNLIGTDNSIPWNIPEDIKHFKKMTTGSTVIMGRKTYESIGKALPNRKNIVISADKNYKAEGCKTFTSVNQALLSGSESETVFVIGGGSIYETTLKWVETLYITHIEGDFSKGKTDIYFPCLKQYSFKEIYRCTHTSIGPDKHKYHFLILKQ